MKRGRGRTSRLLYIRFRSHILDKIIVSWDPYLGEKTVMEPKEMISIKVTIVVNFTGKETVLAKKF